MDSFIPNELNRVNLIIYLCLLIAVVGLFLGVDRTLGQWLLTGGILGGYGTYLGNILAQHF